MKVLQIDDDSRLAQYVRLDLPGDGMLVDLQEPWPPNGEGIWAQGDFNSDGQVDRCDFGILKDHDGTPSPEPVLIPTPEQLRMIEAWSTDRKR